MLSLVISQYLESHKRLVVPQLGAFIVKEPGHAVLFSELLKRDDGVLRRLLSERGMNELEAAGEIDRFVFEVRHAAEHGGEYPLPGFGVLAAGPNGTVAFRYDPAPVSGTASPESPAAELSAAELLSTLESSAVEVLEEQAVKDTAARIAERESAILFLIDIVLFSFELVLFS